MPEIVEIRTDAEALDFYLSNRQLVSINFCNDLFKNKCKGIEDLNKELPLQVEHVISKAKKLFIKLVNYDATKTWWIFLTYGMTGKISQERRKHSHIHFKMSYNYIGFNDFYYENARRIGFVIASNDLDEYKKQLYDMDKQFALGYSIPGFERITLEEFTQNIRNCKNNFLVKVLMDQRSVGSGIGNYLLSEIMYDCMLHPDIRCSELTSENIIKLFNSIEKIITLSYNHGGVSMRDYTHIDETHGDFEKHLKVYGKENEKDSEGQTILVKEGKHGRNIWFVEFN